MAKSNARRFKKVKKVKDPYYAVSSSSCGVNARPNVVTVPGTKVGVSNDETKEVTEDIVDHAHGVKTSVTIEENMEADNDDIKDGIDAMKVNVKVEEVMMAFGENGIRISEVEKEVEVEVEVKEKSDVGDEAIVVDVKNVIEKKESPTRVNVRKKIQSRFATKFWKGRSFSDFSLKERTSFEWEDMISAMVVPSTSESSLKGDKHSNAKFSTPTETTGESEGLHQIPLEYEHSCVKLPFEDVGTNDSDDSIHDPYQFLDAYFSIPNTRVYMTNYDQEIIKVAGIGNYTESERCVNYAEVGIGSEGNFKEFNIESDSNSTNNPPFAPNVVHDGPLSSREMEPKEDDFKDVTDLNSSIIPFLKASKSNKHHYKKSGIQFKQFLDSESEYSQPSASPSFCGRFFANLDTPMDSGVKGRIHLSLNFQGDGSTRRL